MHILITGASSGIGEALARHFGSDPVHQITLVARRLEKLEALASELSAQAYPLRADLSLPDSAEKVVANATQRFDFSLLPVSLSSRRQQWYPDTHTKFRESPLEFSSRISGKTLNRW